MTIKYFAVSVTYNGTENNIPGNEAHLKITSLIDNNTSFSEMKNFKYVKVFNKDDEITCHSFRYI